MHCNVAADKATRILVASLAWLRVLWSSAFRLATQSYAHYAIPMRFDHNGDTILSDVD
jgi:hypothetical protein